ncbi:ABC transporter substrate-binding protein [Desemzia sp. RIT804]|uniref:ABC transporter substrate-binding protein n=1 Tax=Desemzia sp. RIT 804 TaxID=2810209 RepID=UPI0019509FE4|nr:ABC transporter substrate-binding protein [Desemzia sp. RIT 804]MBM6614391.1 ABC transporter substrate-binding protein [Desemzia sp. RIT 804]
MKKKLLLGLAALSVFATACGAGGSTADGDTIKLGAMFEKTGPVSAYGSAESNGVKLAVKEINEAGGVLGKQLEIVEYDTKSDNTEATSIATRLATEDGVVAIVGPATSGAVQAATQPITRAEVPLITPSGTADNLTVTESGEVQPFVFRTSFQDSFQGVALANFATEHLQSEKAVIIGDSSSDYAVGLTDAFKNTYEGEIVAEEYFTQDDTDFSAILTKIQNQDFDVIYLPAYYEQAGLILKQAREMGIEQPILGGDGFSNQALLDLAGIENVTDVYYSAHFSLENEDEQVQTFIDNYTAEYDTAPDAFSALAYDAVYLVAQALEDGGEATPEAVTAALESITDFDGVTGTFSIDENHNPIKSTLIIEVQEGKEASTQEIQP